MRSIPRMKQGRAAFELHNASVSILMSPSSYGVYTDKVIAATQRKNEGTVHCLISNPDKYFCIVFLIVFPFLIRSVLPLFPLLMRMLLPHILFCFFLHMI